MLHRRNIQQISNHITHLLHFFTDRREIIILIHLISHRLQKLDLQSALILIVFGLLSWPVMKAFCRLNDHMRARFEAWRAAKTAKAA
jgi:hypothetical protein